MTKNQLSELIKLLEGYFDSKFEKFVTKDDLKNFATKDDLKNFATKDDLEKVASRLETKIDDCVKYSDMSDFFQELDDFKIKPLREEIHFIKEHMNLNNKG